MRLVEVVLFDLDGTLVDHDGARRAGVVGWLTNARLASADDCERGLVELWDEIAERHFAAFHSGQITFQEQRRRRLREFLPPLGIRAERIDEGSLDAIFEDYQRHYEAAWRAYEDVLPCLSALAGLRVAVLSNGGQKQQEHKLRRTGLLDHFEVVMTPDGLGVAKPLPEAYRRACARLGVEPGLVAYVGDRLEVDAQAATTAGLRGIWLHRKVTDGRHHERTIDSLQELPAILGIDAANSGIADRLLDL